MKKTNKIDKLDLPEDVRVNPHKVRIHNLLTGVRGLDDILGGGVPQFSFNVIAGPPGCGATFSPPTVQFRLVG